MWVWESCKLENKLDVSESRCMWQGLNQITNYKSTISVVNDDPKLPDSLNEIWSHFDNNQNPTRPPTVSSSLTPHSAIEVYEVRNLLWRQSSRSWPCVLCYCKMVCKRTCVSVYWYFSHITCWVQSPCMFEVCCHHPCSKEIHHQFPKQLQTCSINICSHENLWMPCMQTSTHLGLLRSAPVCNQGKQMCRGCCFPLSPFCST